MLIGYIAVFSLSCIITTDLKTEKINKINNKMRNSSKSFAHQCTKYN